jgi:hypothetical protein
MLFTLTDQSRAFADNVRTEAARSGLLYGPVVLVLLLFSAWVKLGNTPIVHQAYACIFFLVVFLYYYNNIYRRGRLFSRIMATVWVSEGKLCYRTHPWPLFKSTEGAVALQDLTVSRKTRMSLPLLEFSSGPKVTSGDGVYLIEHSLVNEPALLQLIEQWPKGA